MEAIIILLIAVAIAVGAIAILTALINTVLVALGFSAISWWTVVLVLVIIRLIKWLTN